MCVLFVVYLFCFIKALFWALEKIHKLKNGKKRIFVEFIEMVINEFKYNEIKPDLFLF